MRTPAQVSKLLQNVVDGVAGQRVDTKPLPTGVGRILDMLLQVLKYDVFGDCPVGG